MKNNHMTPGRVTLTWLQHTLTNKKPCKIEEHAWSNVHAAEALVTKKIADKQIVYGVNTGFGVLANQCISRDELSRLQKNLVLSHACGTGRLLSDEIVALILLLKANCLAQGFSGVRKEIIDALIGLYNAHIYPCVPAKGSVGASGDLAPLAHLALPLLGVGNVRYQGECIPATEGLALIGLKPFELQPKEGLALLNGLQVSTGICVDAWFLCERLFHAAILAGSLSVEAAKASLIPFDARIQKVRGHEAQVNVGNMYRTLLKGSEIQRSHLECSRVQDPYSLRCQPQIMGAVLQQMRFVEQTLAVEINGVTDNPLVFMDTMEILSGGNFHGEMIAMAADNLALAIAEMGANAERRIALLIDRQFSGLPPFLVKESGVNSGFMIAHVTAAACASENKALAHPRSVDSIPTSANQEDHVSMATGAAYRLQEMLDNTATILAIEILAACQGIEFHAPIKTSDALQQVCQKVRAHVPSYEQDRYFAPDIELIKALMIQGEFSFDDEVGVI